MFNTEKLLTKYKLFYQYPVITELEFYNQNINESTYCGIPWATIIDKKYNKNSIIEEFISFFDKNVTYYTCCQHIYFRDLIQIFKIFNIKTVYTPHKLINEDYIDNIKIMPCPLYAVNIEDNKRNIEFQNIDFINIDRPILYSFMGAYDQHYISDIRKDIFIMEHCNDAVIINIGKWHFNDIVYSHKQNQNIELNIDKKHIDNKTKYNELLLKSKFSLCPSGAGPSSIRFYESLAVGSIPVLLSDDLDLPYNIDWDNTIIKIKEKDIKNIENILKNIDKNRIQELKINCINVYNKLKKNYKCYSFIKQYDLDMNFIK